MAWRGRRCRGSAHEDGRVVTGDRRSGIAGNLDLARTIYAAWERGDHRSADWADPEIEFVIADGPAPGRWIGVDSMGGAFRDYIEVWEDARLLTDGCREIEDERVLLLIRRSGRKGKQPRRRQGHAHSRSDLMRFREERVSRLVLYWDRQRALADLGLPPETG